MRLLRNSNKNHLKRVLSLRPTTVSFLSKSIPVLGKFNEEHEDLWKIRLKLFCFTETWEPKSTSTWMKSTETLKLNLTKNVI